MSIITPSGLLSLTDPTGKIIPDMLTAVDVGNLRARMVAAQTMTVFAADPDQANEWYPYARGLYQAPGQRINAAGAPANAFSGSGGVAGGGYGGGNGGFSRAAIFANFQSWEEGIRTRIVTHAAQDGLSGVNDLVSYAQYYNNPSNPGGSAFQILYSPDFASSYWYAYGRQLDPSVVFAPGGIVLCHFVVTATNTGTLSNNAATNWPSANGYTTPAPTTTGGAGTYLAGAWNSATAYTMGPPVPVVLYNGVYYIAVAASTNVTPGTDPTKWAVCTFGNPVYLGGMPVAQAFAPVKTMAAQVTTDYNGTALITVTAKNQNNVNATFTAALDAHVIGDIVDFTPTAPGDRANSVPSAITVAGTATTGAFDWITTDERTP